MEVDSRGCLSALIQPFGLGVPPPFHTRHQRLATFLYIWLPILLWLPLTIFLLVILLRLIPPNLAATAWLRVAAMGGLTIASLPLAFVVVAVVTRLAYEGGRWVHEKIVSPH